MSLGQGAFGACHHPAESACSVPVVLWLVSFSFCSWQLHCCPAPRHSWGLQMRKDVSIWRCSNSWGELEGEKKKKVKRFYGLGEKQLERENPLTPTSSWSCKTPGLRATYTAFVRLFLMHRGQFSGSHHLISGPWAGSSKRRSFFTRPTCSCNSFIVATLTWRKKLLRCMFNREGLPAPHLSREEMVSPCP